MNGYKLKVNAKQTVSDALKALPIRDLVEWWNEYADGRNDSQDLIYDLDIWMKDNLPEMKPEDAFRLGVMAFRFSFSDEYCTFDGYENIMSTDDPLASGWIDLAGLSEWMLDHDKVEFFK